MGSFPPLQNIPIELKKKSRLLCHERALKNRFSQNTNNWCIGNARPIPVEVEVMISMCWYAYVCGCVQAVSLNGNS